MQDFQTYEDVQEWLEPLGYEAFWEETMRLGIYGPGDRAVCDQRLAEGHQDVASVIALIKSMTAWIVSEELDLPFRCHLPEKPDLYVVE
jgi:hypothetical protein